MSRDVDDKKQAVNQAIVAFSQVQIHGEMGTSRSVLDTVSHIRDIIASNGFQGKSADYSDTLDAYLSLNEIHNELLRSLAIEGGDATMQKALHADKDMEAVTESFFKRTRNIKNVLHAINPEAPLLQKLIDKVSEMEREYINTVGSALKEQYGVDVVAEDRRRQALGTGNGGGPEIGGGRISNPREPRGIPGIDRKPAQQE